MTTEGERIRAGIKAVQDQRNAISAFCAKGGDRGAISYTVERYVEVAGGADAVRAFQVVALFRSFDNQSLGTALPLVYSNEFPKVTTARALELIGDLTTAGVAEYVYDVGGYRVPPTISGVVSAHLEATVPDFVTSVHNAAIAAFTSIRESAESSIRLYPNDEALQYRSNQSIIVSRRNTAFHREQLARLGVSSPVSI